MIFDLKRYHLPQMKKKAKDYFKLAKKKPIKINRKATGESFVLMPEKVYSSLFNEIESLKRRIKATNEIIDGKTSEFVLNDKSRLDRFKGK